MADTFFWLGAPRSGLASTAANWQDATTGANPATVAPGAADIAVLLGGAGTDEQIVGGTLGTATLHLPGNSAVEGKLTANILQIGSLATPYALPATAPATDETDAVDVEQGWSLGGTTTSVYSNVEVDGPGALLAAAHLSTYKNTLGTTQGGQVVVANGAALVAANSFDVGVGGLVVDPISIVEVGLLGGARKGAVTIDPGTTFSLGDSTYVYVPVVDNGALFFGGTASTAGTASGGVSGTGLLVVNANGGGTVKGGITGLAQIIVNDGGTLTATDATSGVGAINTGVKSILNVTSLQDDGAIAIGSGATFNVTGAMQRSAGGSMAVSMGSSSVLNLSGQDVNVPIALGTRGNVALNLSAGSNVGGAVTGFDSSDLIRNVQTSTNTLVVNQATWAPGLLTLSSGGTVVTTIALAGDYTGQMFLTNSVGITFGDTDVVLPGAVSNGLGAGAQNLTGGAFRSFNLLTGGGAAGALSIGGNLAMSGTYSAASLALHGTAAGTIDALDLQANSSLAVAGDAGVQSNLELTDHSAMTAGGRLTIGGGQGYFGEVMLLGASRLQAASMTILGETDTLGTINSNPDLAILGSSVLELGSRGGAAAGTLTIDPGATLTSAVETGKIVVATVLDDGAITMAPSAQGLSQLHLTGNLTGSGTLTTVANSNAAVDGSLSGLSAITDAGTLTVGGDLTDSIPLVVGDGASLKVGGKTTGLASLQVGAKATAELDGLTSAVGAISIGASGSLIIKGGSGSGAITVGANATMTEYGALSGWSGISLANASFFG